MRQIVVVTALLALLVGSAVLVVGGSSLFVVPQRSVQATGETTSTLGAGPVAAARARASAARTAETLELMQKFSQSAGQLDLGGKDGTGKLSSPAFGPVTPGGGPAPAAGFMPGANPSGGSEGAGPAMTAALAPDGAAESDVAAVPRKSAPAKPTSSASTPLERYAAAAASGDVNAAYRLGLAYRDGNGVSADPGTAAHWLTVSAAGGQAQAQIALAEMYAKGTGVTRDLAAAYMWFDRAAAGAAAAFARDYASRERDRIAATMSEAELAKAHQMAGQ